ncbi:hypothetical protein BX286_6011 [Streptomyces sp. 3211.6]|nr:hypothetical protein BX286_6011 [Streptomyces sp. 3211.6]
MTFRARIGIASFNDAAPQVSRGGRLGSRTGWQQVRGLLSGSRAQERVGRALALGDSVPISRKDYGITSTRHCVGAGDRMEP